MKSRYIRAFLATLVVAGIITGAMIITKLVTGRELSVDLIFIAIAQFIVGVPLFVWADKRYRNG